jgi:CubicO group peptidase (beta-lactamase class C family)
MFGTFILKLNSDGEESTRGVPAVVKTPIGGQGVIMSDGGVARTAYAEAARRLVQRSQRNGRVPALSAALYRADRPPWAYQVGTSGRPDAPLDAGTRFRIGSITKTFTAVLALQCRDDGLLELDDPISAHLSVPAHGDLTVRRLLSHTSGLQREPFGDLWDTLTSPSDEALVADLRRVERVLAPARRYHYSNLGYGLLGAVVARARGGTWAEVLAERILGPLGLSSIGVEPGPADAVGYLVDEYSDHARPEPATHLGAIAPAGQLWGSAADLARWAAFLTDPSSVDPACQVLSASTVEEMAYPLTLTDEGQWAAAFGLGLILMPQGDRIVHVGHDGAMPGFIAAAYGRRGDPSAPRALGAAVLASSGVALVAGEVTHGLLRLATETDPADTEPWIPGPPAPPPYQSVLGRWWSEGFEFVFAWHDGALQARRVADPAGRPPAIFGPAAGLTAASGLGTEPDGEVLRTVSGREAGELLRLHRDPATGMVTTMHWATYLLTRGQQTFDHVPVSQP